MSAKKRLVETGIYEVLRWYGHLEGIVAEKDDGLCVTEGGDGAKQFEGAFG